jgi:TPR repeat protein
MSPRLFKLAADQGYARGQTDLGFMFESGLGGLAKDEREAVRHYTISAEKGNTAAKLSVVPLTTNPA